jgi:hypothetical protein
VSWEARKNWECLSREGCQRHVRALFIDATKAPFEPLDGLLKRQPVTFKVDDQIFYGLIKRVIGGERSELIAASPSEKVHQDDCRSFIPINEAMTTGNRLHKNGRLPRYPSVISAVRSSNGCLYRIEMPGSPPPPSRKAKSCALSASASLIR